MLPSRVLCERMFPAGGSTNNYHSRHVPNTHKKQLKWVCLISFWNTSININHNNKCLICLNSSVYSQIQNSNHWMHQSCMNIFYYLSCLQQDFLSDTIAWLFSASFPLPPPLLLLLPLSLPSSSLVHHLELSVIVLSCQKEREYSGVLIFFRRGC